MVGGKNLFGLMEYIASNLMLPIGGIRITLFVGWVIYPIAVEGGPRAASTVSRWRRYGASSANSSRRPRSPGS